jgi:CheY-like chemotaxis protein
MNNLLCNNRVLVVDDNTAIHEDIRKVLCQSSASDAGIAEDDAFMFGTNPGVKGSWQPPQYELTSVYQGKEALEEVFNHRDNNEPFAVAIVDMRMPPGWNGLETVQKFWQIDPNLLVVFCTAFSDFSWQQMSEELGQTDRFVILRKPFDNAELQQLVAAMAQRWQAERRAESTIKELVHLTVTTCQQQIEIDHLEAELTILRRRSAEAALAKRALNNG